MFANKIQINLTNLLSGTTATTVNIPLNLVFDMVGQEEIIERQFVDKEIEKIVNPIIDYEKVRFSPLNNNNLPIDRITFLLNLSGATTYGQIGFTDEDIKLQKDYFKFSFLELNFYDSDNPLTQNYISKITLYPKIKSSDIVQFGAPTGNYGQIIRANQMPIMFVSDNPLTNKRGNFEGYYLYDYKDELKFGETKNLYMRAFFKNSKNGKTYNLMVKSNAMPIDMLVHELYTKFKLFRDSTGYYYTIDDTYQGNPQNAGANNVTYSNNQTINSVSVNLYQILAL
jgi:hypothetical protein